MIPFDSFCLAAVVDELARLKGAQIQRAWQPQPLTVVLSLYAGTERLLLLTADPVFARGHLVSSRPPRSVELPPFGQALRRYVVGGRVELVRQRGFDRILEIGISGPEGDVMLVCEFMGKHSNLMLVGSEKQLLGAAKWIGPKLSKRSVLPGKAYEPPPFALKPSLLKASEGDDLRGFEGASPFLLKLIAAGLPLKRAQEAVREGSFEPVYVPGQGAYPLSVALLMPGEVSKLGISQALDAAYHGLVEASRVQTLRDSLLGSLKHLLDARLRAIADLDAAANVADRAAELQLNGELILAYQGQISAGDEELEAWNYQGDPVLIKLAPDLTPAQNAVRYFDKAKKAKARQPEMLEQKAVISKMVAAISGFMDEVSVATTEEELMAFKAAAVEKRWLSESLAAKPKEDRPYEGFSVRELFSPGGYKVLYGTNATSNDYITTKVAKPNDWWFHVRGQTSAHVVLVTANQPEKVGKQDLQYAALVAARNSVAKHSSYVPVDYTLKKYVRKPRGSAAGLATYVNEKVLHVDP